MTIGGYRRLADSSGLVRSKFLPVEKPTSLVNRVCSYLKNHSSVKKIQRKYSSEAKSFIDNFWCNKTSDFIKQEKRRKKAYPLMKQLSVELKEGLYSILKGSSLRRLVERYCSREQLFWIKIFNKADFMGSLLYDFSKRYRDLAFLTLSSGDKNFGFMLKKPTINDLKEVYQKEKDEKEQEVLNKIDELLRGDLKEIKIEATKKSLSEEVFIRQRTEGAKYPGDLESVIIGTGFNSVQQIENSTREEMLNYIFSQLYELFNKSNTIIIKGYNYPLWREMRSILGFGVVSIGYFLGKFSNYCGKKERGDLLNI